jgi:hypothetical protein
VRRWESFAADPVWIAGIIAGGVLPPAPWQPMIATAGLFIIRHWRALHSSKTGARPSYNELDLWPLSEQA